MKTLYPVVGRLYKSLSRFLTYGQSDLSLEWRIQSTDTTLYNVCKNDIILVVEYRPKLLSFARADKYADKRPWWGIHVLTGEKSVVLFFGPTDNFGRYFTDKILP